MRAADDASPFSIAASVAWSASTPGFSSARSAATTPPATTAAA
jgi:hypothetical protein